MAIEAIAIEDLVDVAQEVNCDLNKLVITGADKEAKNAQKHELAKLLPALESGAVNQSVILKFAAQAKDGTGFSTISSATLNKWVNELTANGGQAPAPAPKPEASNNAPVQRSSKHRVNISRAEYNDMEASITAYHKLLATMQGKKLVSEADALVIESIRTNNPAMYNSVLEGIQKETKARLEDEIRAKYQAMMDQELQEKLAAFQPVPVEEVAPANPAELDDAARAKLASMVEQIDETLSDATQAPESDSKKK